MSKLSELIAELCPNGVEHKILADILIYEQPGNYIVHTTDYDDSFETPVLTAGKSFVLGYTNESDGVYAASADDPVIIFDDFTATFHWVDFPFKVKSSAIKMLRSYNDNVAMLRYVYYAMKCIRYVPTDHARHYISEYSNFKIPLPPLKIQQEIVKILDKFTQLQAELQAELELRSKQYEHYRDELLGFDNLSSLAGGVIRKIRLGDAGHFFGGLTGKTSDDFVDGNDKFVTYSGLFNSLSIDQDCLSSVNVGQNEKQNQLRVGDILFTGSSETPEEVAYSSVVTKDLGTVYLNSFCFGYRMDNARVLDPEFAKHLFRSKWVRKQLVKTAMGVTRFNVSKERMKRVEIIIPDISTQRRIAVSLDKFWLYVTGLSDGLPAEIKLRQQQYEYYRDELLSFKLTNV